MRPHKFLLASLILLAINLFIHTSCEKDEFEASVNTEAMTLERPETSAEVSDQISVQNGILVFKNEQDFRNTLVALQKMNGQELAEWENSLGFNSMRSIYDQLVLAEWEQTNTLHSSAYENALNQGIIREKGPVYELNIFNPAYSPVLNQKGLVKIGTELYQFTDQILKIWKNGDANSPEILLSSEEDGQLGIQSIPVKTDIENLDRKTLNWSDKCESIFENSKLLMEARFSSSYDNSLTRSVMFINYNVVAKCLTKTRFGWRINPRAYIELKGYSEMEIVLSDGQNEFTSSEYVKSFGKSRNGVLHITPDLAGLYYVRDRVYFAIPANLLYAEWFAYTLTPERYINECSIIKATKLP